MDIDEGGNGATGGAADLLGAAMPPADGADPASGADGGGADPAGSTVEGGADPDWWATLSAEGGDGDNPSNRDWIKARGTKTLDGLVKNVRDAQRALRDGGHIRLPGEGAKPEEIAEFNKAIGVPDDAKGYAITPPKDADGNDIPLDTDLIGRLAEAAHRHGTPKSAFEGLVADFVQVQLDQAAEFDAQHRAAADALVKSWGASATEKLAAVDRAASALGFSRDDMVAIRNALGSEKALNTFVKLGEGMAEDVLISGGRGRFGVSGAEASAEIERLKADPDFREKLNRGDSAALARWNRLNEAQAAHIQAQLNAA